jgi:hypothetical protein
MTDHTDEPARRELERGFMFDHSLMSQTARQALAGASSALALAQLLVERGVIDEQAFADRRQAIATDFQAAAEKEGLGLFLNHGHPDKYELPDLPQIDCAARVDQCRAACCTYRFPLTRQDVEEGVVQWELGRPYWNRQKDDGYCAHHDPAHGGCRVYDSRPAPCRVFDCRNDERIWSDFDARIVNPDLHDRLAALRGADGGEISLA